MPIQRMSQFPIVTTIGESDRLVVVTAAGPSNKTIAVSDTEFRSDTVLLPAEQMTIVVGTPVIADNLDVAAYWSLDPASAEHVAGKMLIPDHWATFNITARFLNTTAVGGNVRVRADVGTLVVGAIPSTTVGSLVTVAISATQFLIAEATLRTAVAVPADHRVGISVARLGADGADTLAGDVGFLDASLVRAS
jgi:hypothetical protein